ncbi:hypothetical protein HBI80_150340 [Parastagonospora nodorum]|nr:hypothetical protein HBI80_150340 [Parastagonospora nodorum]KAH6373580.1 hypothetical protein HBI34_080430 [Parastagonospora nodorum]
MLEGEYARELEAEGEDVVVVLGGGLDGFESEVAELLDWFFCFVGEEAGFIDEGLVDGSLAVAGGIFAD